MFIATSENNRGNTFISNNRLRSRLETFTAFYVVSVGRRLEEYIY